MVKCLDKSFPALWKDLRRREAAMERTRMYSQRSWNKVGIVVGTYLELPHFHGESGRCFLVGDRFDTHRRLLVGRVARMRIQ
jgi:hypothetical protein